MSFRFRTSQKSERPKPTPDELRTRLSVLHEERAGLVGGMGQTFKMLYFDSGLSNMTFDGDVLGAPRDEGDYPERISERAGEKAWDITLGFFASAFTLFIPQITAPFLLVGETAGIAWKSARIAQIKHKLRKMGESTEVPKEKEPGEDS